MSQIIDNASLPAANAARPPSTRWSAIIAGGLLAATLGYGAALVTTGHLPWIEHPTTATFQASPALEAPQATPIQPGTVDPFEARSASPQTQAAVGVTSAPTPAPGLQPGTIDPFESQFVGPQVLSSIAASGPSMPRAAVQQSALDPIETRLVSSPTKTVVSTPTGSVASPAAAFDTDRATPTFE